MLSTLVQTYIGTLLIWALLVISLGLCAWDIIADLRREGWFCRKGHKFGSEAPIVWEIPLEQCKHIVTQRTCRRCHSTVTINTREEVIK